MVSLCSLFSNVFLNANYWKILTHEISKKMLPLCCVFLYQFSVLKYVKMLICKVEKCYISLESLGPIILSNRNLGKIFINWILQEKEIVLSAVDMQIYSLSKNIFCLWYSFQCVLKLKMFLHWNCWYLLMNKN